jgi:hypothetical protein
MERLKDLIVKNHEEKKKEQSNKLLLKSRKEVEINANGTTGYRIKEGKNQGKVLGHIQVKNNNLTETVIDRIEQDINHCVVNDDESYT